MNSEVFQMRLSKSMKEEISYRANIYQMSQSTLVRTALDQYFIIRDILEHARMSPIQKDQLRELIDIFA